MQPPSTCSEEEFYREPAHFLKEGRKQQKVTVVHSNNGCVVCAILTKEQYQKLLRGESID